MPALYLGLISGTSADGIDAALTRFDPRLEPVHARTYAWDPGLRARLLALGQAHAEVSLDMLGRLDVEVAHAFADAALRLIAEAGLQAKDVRAIGSHGQTVRHRPGGDFPFTWQLGDG